MKNDGEMQMNPETGHIWVDQQELLEQLAGVLRPGMPLALDTEADSLHHYKERLCLIQISWEGKHYLVDPLCGLNMEPLWRGFSPMEWILHGADYDLRMLRSVNATEPAAVFDTMLAAQVLGFQAFGYAALVERYFGLTLCKKNQKADWSRRPLSPDMLAYAVEDTRHLEEIRARMRNELIEKGRLEWHRESCERVVRTSRKTREVDEDEQWQISGYAKLAPTARPILKALWEWREAEAERADLPTFKVVNNENLLHLSQAWDNRSADRPSGRIPHQLHEERRERFLEAIQKGRAAEPIVIERKGVRHRSHPEAEKRSEALRQKRDAVAAELGIDPSFIASRIILTILAHNPEGGAQQLINDDRWCRWQAALLGVDTQAQASNPAEAPSA